jgi:acetoin utilization deacetylase AcuC-like enzyme
VLIVDLDVHQGDGTAAILSTHPEIFTFSMHCARNFPHRKQTSDLDVPLPDGLGDDGFLDVLQNHLPWLLDRFAPELVIYDAGVDVHADDRLGYLSLSDNGLARRDLAVIEACRSRGIATACVIGGGYDRDLAALAARHAVLHQQAAKVWACEHT